MSIKILLATLKKCLHYLYTLRCWIYGQKKKGIVKKKKKKADFVELKFVLQENSPNKD